MDVSRLPSQSPNAVKTEWKANPLTPDVKVQPKAESFGAQLNRISGAVPEGRNLYEKKGEMTKEAYLKMLMEQLKFQDPFNPVKNDQFSQQMTSLSQLEQQVNTNKNLEKMIGQQNNMQIAALQLVGKNILADRSTIYHDKDKSSALQFKLPQDANEVTVEVLDAGGEKIRSLTLGAQRQGDVKTKWDGVMENGQPVESGKYTYRVIAKGMDNKDIPLSQKVDGRVTGVTTSQGVVFLLVGDQRIGLSDVETIKEGQPEDKNPGVIAGNPTGTLPVSNNGSGIPVGNVAAVANNIPAPTNNAPSISMSDEVAKSLADKKDGGAVQGPGAIPLFMR